MVSTTRRELLAGAGLTLLPGLLRAIPLEQIKLGITTDEIDEDVLTAVKFLRRFHLGWAEVRSIWGKYNTVQPVEKIREAKAIVDEHGVKVSIEGTPFFKVPLPSSDAGLDKEWATLDAAMERAKIFGADKIRVFGFMHRGGETPDAKNYPRIYELITEAARRAGKHNLRLALENVGGSYISTGAQAGEMLKHVRESNLGLTWDPNNAAASGEQPFPDGFRKIDAARIFHVHLRNYKHEDGKVVWAPAGEGEFDNVAQIRALLKAGFRGTFTLETHWKSPQGKAYASEYSLKELLEIFAGV